MMSILGIGLDAEIRANLASLNTFDDEVVYLDKLDDAGPLFSSEDVSLVLVDSHASDHLREDMNHLLGETSLTTRIILITHPSDMLSTETYAALGITTLDSPVTAEKLEEAIN